MVNTQETYWQEADMQDLVDTNSERDPEILRIMRQFDHLQEAGVQEQVDINSESDFEMIRRIREFDNLPDADMFRAVHAVRELLQFDRAGDILQQLPRVRKSDIPLGDDVCCICETQYGASNADRDPEYAVRLECCGNIIGLNCITRWLLKEGNNSCVFCRNVFHYGDADLAEDMLDDEGNAALDAVLSALSQSFDLLGADEEHQEEARRSRLSRERTLYCCVQNECGVDMPPLSLTHRGRDHDLRREEIQVLFEELVRRGAFNIVCFRDNEGLQSWFGSERETFGLLRTEGFVWNIIGDENYGWSLGIGGPYLRVSQDPDDDDAIRS